MYIYKCIYAYVYMYKYIHIHPTLTHTYIMPASSWMQVGVFKSNVVCALDADLDMYVYIYI